jgi:hypothetical protein
VANWLSRIWVPTSASGSSSSSATFVDSQDLDSTSGSSSSSATFAGSQDPTFVDSSANSVGPLPNVPLLRVLAEDDHPHYIEPPARLPENTHPGNDRSTQPTFTLTKSPIRTYHISCSTFLDLVDDPDPDDWQGTQRLRLRAGSRRLGPPLLDYNRLLRSPSDDLSTALAEMYIVPEISFWPPAQHPIFANRDKDIDKIYRLLNPPSHLGNVEGMADERSLVYVTGGEDKPQALIFIGFDPAIKLEGLTKWGGLCGDEEGEGKGKGKSVYVDVGEVDRTVSDRKGKGKAKIQYCNTQRRAAVTVSSVGGGDVAAASAKVPPWVWEEKAMYQDIKLGFDFSLNRRRPSS